MKSPMLVLGVDVKLIDVPALMKSIDKRYMNSDGTFKNGFKGCVAYMKAKEGYSDKVARETCAKIARRKGK